jgi:hypothetical protein
VDLREFVDDRSEGALDFAPRPPVVGLPDVEAENLLEMMLVEDRLGLGDS